MIGFSVCKLNIEIFFTCSNNIQKLDCTSNIIKIHTLAQLCSNISKICSQNWLFRLAHLAVLWWSFFMVLFFENMFYHIISVRCRLNIIAGGLAFYLLYIFGIILYIYSNYLLFISLLQLRFLPFSIRKKNLSVPFFLPNIFIKHQKPHANYTISVGIIQLYTPQPSSQCKM